MTRILFDPTVRRMEFGMNDDDRDGRWVPVSEINPMANVHGLRWRDEDGREGPFEAFFAGGAASPTRVAAWFVPKAPREPAPVAQHSARTGTNRLMLAAAMAIMLAAIMALI